MDNYNQRDFSNYTVIDSKPISGSRTISKKFMSSVFTWMFFALGVSALFAVLFSSNPSLMGYMVNVTEMGDGTVRTGLNILGWLVMLSPLGFVLLMSFGFNRLSSPAMTALFILYAA